MAVRPDELDRKILGVLQEDASRSLDDIAKSVGSSKTPVWNRIKKMRESGVIGQHTVILDADALGLEACFFVLIRTSALIKGVCGLYQDNYNAHNLTGLGSALWMIDQFWNQPPVAVSALYQYLDFFFGDLKSKA